MAVEFRCADVGIACRATTTADTPEELVAKVVAHARETHDVELNDTLVDYALSEVRHDRSANRR